MSTITNRGIIYAALECPTCPGHALLQTRLMPAHMARHKAKAQALASIAGAGFAAQEGNLSECADCGGYFMQIPGLGSLRCAPCRLKHLPSRKGIKYGKHSRRRGAVESDVSIRQNRKARPRGSGA